MGLYERHVLPHLIHCACGQGDIADQRRAVLPLARGTVLEVGMGSGLNLPFYDRERVDRVVGVEPSEGMRRKAARRLERSEVEVEWLVAGAESVPLEDRSVDSVVLTYTLCTIPDWRAALAEIRRVLRPEGLVLFAEHGLAPDEGVRRWQRRIEPLWKPLAGGCHLTRPTLEMLETSGFDVEDVVSGYLRGPRWAAFNTRGVARPRQARRSSPAAAPSATSRERSRP